MAQLLDELTVRGGLDPAAIDWAKAHQAARGGSLDSALLELDLIDEESLLRSLESCYGLPAAHIDDALSADANLAKRVPQSLSEALAMCPVRTTEGGLVALVEQPLSDRWVDELRLTGLEVEQLVAPAHYLDLARGRVYEPPTAERAEELETRLARRRAAITVGQVVASVEAAESPAAATVIVLDYAAELLSFSCFLVSNGHSLRLGAVSGGAPASKEQFPVPETSCTFGAAIQYGGYFVGPLAGTQADHDFYRALGRPLPRWAFVAPVPLSENLEVVFYADNGARGMAARWIAELTILIARLGQHARTGADRARQRTRRSDLPPESIIPETVVSRPSGPPAEPSAPPPEPSAPPPESSGDRLTDSERVAVDRLRGAASEAGVTLEVFIDSLLHRTEDISGEEASTVLAGEVRGLFEKLATDIPTQLARGMEAAFRDMAPRLNPTPAAPGGAGPRSSPPGASPKASSKPPANQPSPSQTPPRAANVELVHKPNAPREVASYRSRRGRSKRLKL